MKPERLFREKRLSSVGFDRFVARARNRLRRETETDGAKRLDRISRADAVGLAVLNVQQQVPR